MKIGVMGAGHWGQNLINTLHSMSQLDMVFDLSQDAIDRIAPNILGVKTTTNVEDILESDIDAVVIATPVVTHYEIAMKALKAGKDVFVEKPITFNSRDAKELVAMADELGKVLMVGHLLLYQPAIQWTKEFLSSGKLGNVISMHQRRLNLGRARQNENAMWSLGVHDIAVLLYLNQSGIKNTVANGLSHLTEGVEDDVYLHIDFKDGARAHLHSSWLWPVKARDLTIIGSEGMLVYDELKQTVTLHKKRIDSNLNNVDNGEDVVFKGGEQPLRLELAHFIECCYERRKPHSDGVSAVEVIQVLEDASAAHA